MRIYPDVQQASLEASATAPKPCAFYSVMMAAAGAPGISHRCLLNPGKAQGPDGAAIGVSQCTLERQAQCQAQRRANFARLHASAASIETSDAAAQAI
jgi:hypothetical protein